MKVKYFFAGKNYVHSIEVIGGTVASLARTLSQAISIPSSLSFKRGLI